MLSAFTRAPAPLRKLGLVQESIGLWARRNRQRKAWATHEAHCHKAVERAVAGLSQTRTVVVLGSGLVRDVPIDLLCSRFSRVVLVDAVHLPLLRWRMRRYPNVTLVTRDLTGVAGWLGGKTEGRADPVADFASDPQVDLVISANVLSQLPLGVEHFLDRHASRAAALPPDLAARTVGWHLSDLRRFDAPVCLLTDVEMREENRRGEVVERLDLLRAHRVTLRECWEWDVAPFGEAARNTRFVHRAGVAETLAG